MSNVGSRPLVVAAGAAGEALAGNLDASFRSFDDFQSEDSANAAVGQASAVVLAATPETTFGPSESLRRLLNAAFRIGCAASATPQRRIVVVSSLGFFARCPSNWQVDARWRPRPTTQIADLAPHLTELSVRESVRETGAEVQVVRLGTDVSPNEAASAIREAIDAKAQSFFDIRHVGERPAASADDRPWRTVLAAPDPIPSRPIRNVVVFGAGGPLAAALAPLLMEKYRVRLTDLRPLADIQAAGYPHQPPGSPLPAPPLPPHEEMRCDVTDPDQVMAACEGMDAIINCSVIRYTEHDFGVNALGCYHIARAAARHRIRRVVQTGPQVTALDSLVGYHADYDVPGDAPSRPGRNLYGHTKYLGNETLRVFAEWHDLEVPVLVFNGFVTAASRGRNAFESTFEECAEAVFRALEAPSFPSPYEYITVCADLPMGRFSPQRAKELLGWETQQYLEDTWRD